MEARVITIIMESSNGYKTVTTGAETLGELKRDLDAAGINYEDKTFREGITRTELIDDDSALPKDVTYRGEVTNNLVFTLLTSQKKIKSGAMTRAEAYEAVKEFGLQSAVKLKFGKNFTQVSTPELEKFIQGATPAVEAPAPSRAEVAVEQNKDLAHIAVAAIRKLVEALEESEILDSWDADLVREILEGSAANTKRPAAPWSEEELAKFSRI